MPVRLDFAVRSAERGRGAGGGGGQGRADGPQGTAERVGTEWVTAGVRFDVEHGYARLQSCTCDDGWANWNLLGSGTDLLRRYALVELRD